jgi:hypothetical protein
MVEEDLGPLVETAGGEDARRHLDRDLATDESHGDPGALIGARGAGGEVVVVRGHGKPR